MQKTQQQAYYAGPHFLPPLTEQEVEDWKAKRYHLVRKSAHVQAMEQLINASHSVDPTEVHGAVLYYEGEDTSPSGGYILLQEDEEDGDLGFKLVIFLNTGVTPDVINRLEGMTKEQLVQERFRHVPPRSVL